MVNLIDSEFANYILKKSYCSDIIGVLNNAILSAALAGKRVAGPIYNNFDYPIHRELIDNGYKIDVDVDCRGNDYYIISWED